MNQKILFTILFIFTVSNIFGQIDAVIGKWTSIDDATGKAKSVIQIFKTPNGIFYGKIDQLLNRKAGEENPNCKHCDAYNGKYKTLDGKTIGMLLIRDLVYNKSDNEWIDGTIFDPENGKEYSCSLKIVNAKLNVRGSLDPWGIAGRTQVWLPEK